MRGIKILIIICLVNTVAYGQPYFSKVYNFELPNVIFTNVEELSDSILITAVITDTIEPLFNSMVITLDKKGNVGGVRRLDHTFDVFDLWRSNLHRLNDSLFVIAGEAYNEFSFASIITMDSVGKIYKEQYIENPFAPEKTFALSNTIQVVNEEIYYSFKYTDKKDNSSDIKIFKFDSQLNILDTLIIDDQLSISCYSILESIDYNLLYGMHRLQVVEKGFTYENIIQKRDANFNLIWEYRTDPDSLYSSLEAMTTTSDGGVVAATYAGVEYYVNPGSNSYCRDDVYVYKLDKDGELVWEKWIPEQGCVAVVKTIKEVQELKDKTLLFAGTMPYQDKFRGTIFKLDENGEDIWYRYYIHEEKNLTSFHIFNDMALMDNGDILLCGESKGPQEGWLMRVDSMGCLIPGCNTAIDKISDEDPIDLLLYPNPVQDQLIVHIAVSPTYKEGKLSLINAMGQELKSWDNSMSELSHIVDVSEVPSGLYQLIYTSNGRVLASEQVVVER